MNLRIKLYDTLVNNSIMIRLVDLDNEGGAALVNVYISNYDQILEINVDHIFLSPVDIFMANTPLTGYIHEVTAKIFDKAESQLHDADTKMIKLEHKSTGAA